MYIKYIETKEKSLVFNEKEEITKRKTTKNLGLILKQENKIELIENQLSENEKTVKESKSKIKSFKTKAIWLTPLCTVTALLAGDAFLVFNFIVLHIESTNVIWDFKEVLEDMITFSKPMSIIGILYGSILSLFCLSNAKNIQNHLESAELESFFLELDLEKEQEKLINLKANDQPLELETDEASFIYIDNQGLRNKYREYLMKLSFYGERIKKYNKMLEQNHQKLETEMSRDEIDVDLLETYIRSRKKKERGFL